jgi:hypothetical protein
MRFDDFMYGGDMYNGDMFSADEYSGGYGGLGLPSFAVAPPPAYEAPSFAVDPYTAPPAYSQEEIQRAAQAFAEQRQREQALATQSSGALNNYIAEQAAKGVEVASTDQSQGGGPLGSSGVFGLPDFGVRFNPANPAASTGQVFRFDTGSKVGVPGASGEMEYRNAAPVVFQPGQKYIMTDGRSEKVLGSATTPEEMAGLVDLSGKLPYGFQLFQANEQGDFTPGQELFGKDDPRATGVLGAIANYGIPLAMGLLAAPITGPLAAAAAAAGTTGVTKLTSGYTPKDALIAAAISGVTAGALKGFTGPSNPLGLEPFGTAAKNAAAEAAAQGVGGAVAQGAGGALSQAIPSLGEMVVTGFRDAAPSILSQVAPSVVQAGVSGLGNALLPSQPATVPRAEAPDPNLITVTAPRVDNILTSVAPAVVGPIAGDIVGGLTQAAPVEQQQPQLDKDEIVVTAPRPDNILTDTVSALLPTAVSSIVQPTPSAPAVDPDEIVVTQEKYPDAKSTGALDYLSNVIEDVIPEPETAFDKAKRIGGRVLQGLAVLGPLLSGTGGKQGQGLSTLGPGAAAIGTRASLDPTFSARLPAPGGLFAAQAMAPRNMGNIDYARYGYGPARSFFENVPDTPEQYRTALAAAAPRPMTPQAPGGFNPNLNILDQFGANSVRRFAPNATDEQVNAFLTSPAGIDFIAAVRESESPQGLARGGAMAVKGKRRPSRDSYAVNGPGTGRSDEIPALLSDGEYVIDAETVAMLGDGSSAAGAKRLDDLRVKIRKHKGRNLAKGRFSDNAKRPEKYLSGGRA